MTTHSNAPLGSSFDATTLGRPDMYQSTPTGSPRATTTPNAIPVFRHRLAMLFLRGLRLFAAVNSRTPASSEPYFRLPWRVSMSSRTRFASPV